MIKGVLTGQTGHWTSLSKRQLCPAELPLIVTPPDDWCQPEADFGFLQIGRNRTFAASASAHVTLLKAAVERIAFTCVAHRKSDETLLTRRLHT